MVAAVRTLVSLRRSGFVDETLIGGAGDPGEPWTEDLGLVKLARGDPFADLLLTNRQFPSDGSDREPLFTVRGG